MAKEMEALAEDQDTHENAFTEAIGDSQPESEPESEPESSVEETPPEQEAPVEEPASTPEPSPFDDLVTQARGMGLDVDGYDSEAALARGVMQQLEKQQPYVAYAQQLLPHADDIRSYFDSKNAPAPAPEQEQEAEWTPEGYLKERYGGPEWRDDFTEAINTGLVTRDPESGLWVAAPGQEIAAGSVLQDLNKAQQHTNKFWQGLANKNPYADFYEVLKEPILREVERRVEDIVGQRESQTKQRDVVAEFETQHSDWMYATDPTSGQRVPTEAGQEFIGTVNDLRNSGINDPAKLLSIASRMHGIGAEKPSGSPAPEAETPQPDQKQQSFLDSARKRAQHTPSARQRGGDDVPQVASEGDLDSLFERAYKESASKK